jgi:hypothetical protein
MLVVLPLLLAAGLATDLGAALAADFGAAFTADLTAGLAAGLAVGLAAGLAAGLAGVFLAVGVFLATAGGVLALLLTAGFADLVGLAADLADLAVGMEDPWIEKGGQFTARRLPQGLRVRSF